MREVAHAPLPVGETGEVKRKGSMKGGGSPGLHKPMLFMGAEGWGYPSSGRSFTLALRQGQRPLAALFFAKGISRDRAFHWPVVLLMYTARSGSPAAPFAI